MALLGARARIDRRAESANVPEFGRVARTIVKNVAWLTAAQLGAGVAQFAMIAMLARHLGPSAYGRWGFAAAFVSLFAAVADFGLSTLAVRDLARDTRMAPRYLGTAVCIKLMFSVVLFAAMIAIAQLVAPDVETRVLIYVLGGQMFVASTIVLVNSIFRIHERMDVEAIARTAQMVVVLLIVTVLIRAGAGPTPIAFGYLGVTFASLCVISTIARRRFLAERLGVKWRLAGLLLSEAWPLGVGMIATAFYYSFDSIYMGTLGQAQQVGWYAAAYAPILFISQIVGVMRTAFLPAQSRTMAGECSPLPVLRFYARTSASLATAVAMGGVLLAGPLLRVAYGHAYEPATFALQVLCVTAGIMFFSSFYGSQLLVAGRQRTYLVGVAAGAVLNVGLNVFIIPRYSLDGAAVTTLASESLVCLFMLWQGRSSFGLREIPGYLRIPIGGGAVLLLLVTAGRSVLPVSGAAVLGGLAYAAIILRFGQFDAHDDQWPRIAPDGRHARPLMQGTDQVSPNWAGRSDGSGRSPDLLAVDGARVESAT